MGGCLHEGKEPPLSGVVPRRGEPFHGGLDAAPTNSRTHHPRVVPHKAPTWPWCRLRIMWSQPHMVQESETSRVVGSSPLWLCRLVSMRMAQALYSPRGLNPTRKPRPRLTPSLAPTLAQAGGAVSLRVSPAQAGGTLSLRVSSARLRLLLSQSQSHGSRGAATCGAAFVVLASASPCRRTHGGVAPGRRGSVAAALTLGVEQRNRQRARAHASSLEAVAVAPKPRRRCLRRRASASRRPLGHTAALAATRCSVLLLCSSGSQSRRGVA